FKLLAISHAKLAFSHSQHHTRDTAALYGSDKPILLALFIGRSIFCLQTNFGKLRREKREGAHNLNSIVTLAPAPYKYPSPSSLPPCLQRQPQLYFPFQYPRVSSATNSASPPTQPSVRPSPNRPQSRPPLHLLVPAHQPPSLLMSFTILILP